ncbi:MAG: CotH kinase family protein, partial [Pirellulales bacterium]
MRQIVRRSWWGWCAGLAHRRGPRLLAVGTDSQSPHRRAKRATLRFEPLEERQLLASDLVITEFAASNGNTLPDSDGDRSDWIEIHNRTDEPVQLQGWYLTDDANELTRWTFPSIQLAPRGYQIVFASGKDRAYDSFRLTTDFHATPDRTFRIDLDAGLYDIRLTVGDAKKARDEMAISIQSERLDVLSTDAGEFIARTYRAEVTADSGGQLAIRIEDLGGETGRAAINALSITPAVGGTPHRFDFGKEDSPLEPGFTRVTATDTYSTVAGFGWDAGVVLSEVDRGVDRDELHTNFKLSSRGEYLGLVEPDGTTIAFEYAPEYPPQQTAVSYGLEQEEVVSTPVGTGAEAAILVPTAANGGDLLGRSWTAVDFDDSAWRDGPTGVGFVDSESLQDLIATDIRSEMQGITASAYLRVPFTIEQPRAVFSLQLRMAYDDGYVAYLNGVEVARANAPDTLGPNSEATSTRSDLFARDFEEIDISEQIGLLRDGTNVLAIQGLNRRASGDPFFLVHPELQVGRSLDIRRVEPRYFASPTPGTPNGLNSFAALTPTPQVNIAGGLFDEPFDVVVNSDVPGATLVITTDGSRPTLENGLQVDGADAETRPTTTISVSGTTVLRAAAFNEDWMPSRMTARTYIFPDDVIAQDVQATLDAGFPERWGDRTVATSPGNGVPDYGPDPDIIGPNDLFGGIYAAQLANSLRAAPTLSIVMDLDDLFDPETGIYSNPTRSGFEWERPTSVEWITTDGSPGFQVNAGIRIMGGFSRRASKKNSLRLEFRKQYGPSRLQFPLFGDGAAGEFETLALRAHFNDGYTLSSNPHFIRDQWTRATQLAMGQPSSRGTNAHLYINGIYWGLYNPVERPDASFSATYLGGDENDWDAINSNGVVDGTVDAWNELLSLSGPVATAADQQQSNAALLRLLGKDPDGTDNPEVETLLDVDNYIDYMLLNFFTGNNDWPHNNYYMARRRGPESTGFKFYSWDAERSLNNTQGKFADVNTDVTGVSRGVAVLHARLVKNDEFRLMFADRVRRHFSPGGALYVDPANPAWDPENPQRNIPAARYKELADQIALPLVAESARWADALSANPPPTVADWQVLIDGMLENWLPQRPAILLEQLTARGLYPEVAAPEFNQHGGEIVPGFDLTMSAPGDVYYTLDGSDPRQSVLEPGVTESGISPTAIKYSRPVQLTEETPVKARTFADGEWSALSE